MVCAFDKCCTMADYNLSTNSSESEITTSDVDLCVGTQYDALDYWSSNLTYPFENWNSAGPGQYINVYIYILFTKPLDT